MQELLLMGTTSSTSCSVCPFGRFIYLRSSLKSDSVGNKYDTVSTMELYIFVYADNTLFRLETKRVNG